MEELDLEDDVLVMVAQEATAIVDVLCEQRINVLNHIYALVEPRTLEQLQRKPSLRETISGVVEFFKTSKQQTCRHFLCTIWELCENIPLDLEIRILSIAGSSAGKFVYILPDSSLVGVTMKLPYFLFCDSNNLEM